MSRPKELNFFIEERNWPRGVDWYRATSTPTRHGPRRGLAQLHGLSAAPGRAGADALRRPRREADLHGARPARPDRRALGPQLRQAAREGRPASTLTHPNTSYLARSQVHDAAAAVPRALPEEQVLVIEQDELRDQRDGDAAPDVRVRRRRPRLHAPRLRARAPPDVAQDARRRRLAVRLERSVAGAGAGCSPPILAWPWATVLPLAAARSSAPTFAAALPARDPRGPCSDDAEKPARADRPRLRRTGRSGRPDGNNRAPEERDRRRKARAAKSQAIKPEKHEHSHPGGTAAAIGTHLAKLLELPGHVPAAHQPPPLRVAHRGGSDARTRSELGPYAPAVLPDRPGHADHPPALASRAR